MNRARAFARRLGLGVWLLRNYHQRFPRLNWLLQFGVAGAIRYACGESAMRRAARRLPPIDESSPDGFTCSFMTGRGYWQQTLFCAHSLATVLDGPLHVTLLDDGTLTPKQTATLLRVLPGVRLIARAEIDAVLQHTLPRSQFPRLRELRDRMPMMRKLVDLRASRSGWQLYLDSDMLFLRRPDFLVECERTSTSCHMVDRLFAYSLPSEQLAQLSGRPVPACVNAGIVGLDDRAINWPEVETWVRQMPAPGLNPQLLEQTLTAMLLGHFESRAAPSEAYHILYTRDATPPPAAVLLHYIYHAKLRYFTRDWRSHAQKAGVA